MLPSKQKLSHANVTKKRDFERPQGSFVSRVRTRLWPLTLTLLLAATASHADTVRDEFTSESYTGNNGTANWFNSWQEFGESNGPTSGTVEVVTASESGFRCAAGNCLEIGGSEVSINNDGVSRIANLTGATSATLTFSYRRRELDGSSGSVSIQVRPDAASSWTNLQTYSLSSSDGGQVPQSFDITAFASATTEIRFIGSGSDVDAYFYADNVQIQYLYPAPPTSCNIFPDQDSFLDQGSPGANYGSDGELSAKDSVGDDKRAVFRYDLSSIPLGSTITSATAYYYVTAQDDSGNPVNIHRITDSWTEGGVTWNNTSADYNATVRGAFSPALDNSWVNADLTSLVQDWVGGTWTNYGLMFLSNSANESKYASKEWGTTSERPCMEVSWTPPSADLEITKTASPDPAPLDGPLLYTLLVTNNGPSTAPNVVVTDALPGSVTLASAAPSQGSCSGTTTVTCNLGSILNGGTASVEILVTTTATGSISNTASATSDAIDAVPGNDSATVITDVVTGISTDVPLTQYKRLNGLSLIHIY